MEGNRWLSVMTGLLVVRDGMQTWVARKAVGSLPLMVFKQRPDEAARGVTGCHPRW